MAHTLADSSTATQLEQERTHARRPTPRWARRYLIVAVTVDTVAVLIAAAAAEMLRFGHSSPSLSFDGMRVPYPVVAAFLIPVWLAVIALGGCYDYRVFGSGTDEYRKLITAGAQFFGAVAVLNFVFRLDIARGYVAAAIPLAISLSLGGRYLLRTHLHSLRTRGKSLQRVLVVGSRTAVEQLTRHLSHPPVVGFQVVAARTVESDLPRRAGGADDLRMFGGIADLLRSLETLDIDTLVVANASIFPPGGLQQLSWGLEDLGISLIVSPAVTDIAGPRISIRPVAGLPLLHVETPRFSVGGRVYKAVFDRCVALGALVLLSPMLLLAAVAVHCTSRGPVLFRQQRVGMNGQPFVLWKFRTMVRDAPDQKAVLADANDSDGVLFKLYRDPRITKVGRLLRRFSIDELPQLAHALSGKMSIVGPRPPLRDEVARYEGAVGRRLLVKPGITGLWQVEGRSDLPWDEAVRLDLYYVDHWSPAMDFAILVKTAGAVIHGRGAY